MKKILSTCLLALITTWSMANTPITASNDPETENMSVYEAINKAGYQRMLTQRIAKSYLAIMCEIDVNKYKEHLKTSAKLFDSNLKALKEYSPTEEIRNQNRYTEILWTNYKFIYSDEYTANNANIILEFNDKILKACHETVVLLEAYAKEQSAHHRPNLLYQSTLNYALLYLLSD